MKKNNTGRVGKVAGNTLNTVVNIAVLGFLGYALLGAGGPLRMKIREYASAREARMAAQDILEQLASAGRVDTDRPTIIEFTDFQCPYCREMHDILRDSAARTEFDLVVMHFPLEAIHPLAKAAAKASLCAQSQRSAEEMNHLLMSTSDWMDDTGWGRLAREAGVPDLKLFERCLESPSTEQELTSQVALARNLGVRATPTFVSYGGIHSGVATLEELIRLAEID